MKTLGVPFAVEPKTSLWMAGGENKDAEQD